MAIDLLSGKGFCHGLHELFVRMCVIRGNQPFYNIKELLLTHVMIPQASPQKLKSLESEYTQGFFNLSCPGLDSNQHILANAAT